MSTYNIIAATNESTVVAEYTPESSRSEAYQSEAELEKAFIKLLSGQGYEYISVTSEAALIANLRCQLEKLNGYTFTDNEWERFFTECIANSNDGIVEKTRKIQTAHVQAFRRDDGTTKNITLLDKKNIHNNRLQVLNQYEESAGRHDTRYDVTILVNGLPLVHVELKRRGVAIREAFNQIKRYQRDSFWAASGLYEYVQIFVISNGTHTKYYSNTTRDSHIKEMSSSGRKSSKKTSNSFEFTSFWADGKNNPITDLVDFTKTFFAKHTLLNIITKYCVFTAEDMLLVMRPYQITATERIVNRVLLSTNYKKTGTIEAGGYIWHSTGTGKTLTSFKTAQLLSKEPYIDKVLFVVDRKDLDYQTMKEYDRFQKGAANSNKSTRILQAQLENDDARIIITTIQKLDQFVSRNAIHPVYKKHVVIIFDECHRSQFGLMHDNITRHFKNYHLFGFTGTPIFAVNASASGRPDKKTTPQVFGDKLHTYTIVNGINDGNVLPFRIDYINTVREKDGIMDKEVSAIDRERALNSAPRISEITKYILEHFDQKTKRNAFYSLKGKRVSGFNSILAVSSIETAKKYYAEFSRLKAEGRHNLVIATIFSYAANEEDPEDGIIEEGFETELLDSTSRDFLEQVIADYNQTFKTNYNTSSNEFQNYYKDLSQRVKNREIDILIVVDMFLTGFDATTLNTLWVDKNLKMHGLIQAFSRTNRILNSVKTYGNIVCFRNLQENVDKAIALFGDENAESIVLLRKFDDYYSGYDVKGKHVDGYVDLVNDLQSRFPLGTPIVGEEDQKEFLRLFAKILRLNNILTAFDDFKGQEIISQRDFQDYQSIYIDTWDNFKPGGNGEKANIVDDLVFELELIKQVEINIDYILMLVAQEHAKNCTNREIWGSIEKMIGSTISLRSKKELIHQFVMSMTADTNVDSDWKKYVTKQREEDLQGLIQAERLKAEETRQFIDNAFRDGVLKTTGTDLDKIMPPMSRFGGGRAEKKKGIIEKLKAFFNKYFGLFSSSED